jgi:outer membrane receptor protein involved in Fe transport
MNFHAAYRFDEKLSVIASFTQTIKRPRYSSTTPFRIVNLSEMEIQHGNPDLKPTLYDNFDVSLDYKISENQLLTVETFYRTLEDTQYYRETVVTSGPYEGFISYTPDNGGSGSVYGFKTTWKNKLSESSQTWLRPFAYSFTYTYNHSESDYPLRPGETFPLNITPEQNVLLILKYDFQPFFIQLEFDYQTEMIDSLSSQSPSNDIYHQAYFFINLLLEYTWNEHTVLFMDWSNMNMAYESEKYIGSPSKPYLYKDDPFKILFGIRMSF